MYSEITGNVGFIVANVAPPVWLVGLLVQVLRLGCAAGGGVLVAGLARRGRGGCLAPVVLYLLHVVDVLV